MEKIRVSKRFLFEMAHALLDYDGPCKNIHGHSYELVVTILGPVLHDDNESKNGMVMDFKDLKHIVKSEIVDQLDHCLMLNSRVPESFRKEIDKAYDNVMYVNYQPTSENMLIDFVGRIRKHLKDPLELHSIKLVETKTSVAEWYASDNQ
jgi:6-pyruvoyltetrahydropterin/6-carboxytetrahydropterin synthase